MNRKTSFAGARSLLCSLVLKGLGRAPSVELANTDRTPSGSQARLDRDTAGGTYRCFLPDLTGFVLVCCVVSSRRRN